MEKKKGKTEHNITLFSLRGEFLVWQQQSDWQSKQVDSYEKKKWIETIKIVYSEHKITAVNTLRCLKISK